MMQVCQWALCLTGYAIGIAFLFACSKQPSDQILAMRVERSPFRFEIPAKGELVSAQEIPINAPRGNRGSLTLAWLKEENSQVNKGEIVARFDGSEHILQRERSAIEMEKNQLSKENTERSLAQNQFSVEQEVIVVNEEMQVAERFTIDDLMVYSKNEIVDQMLNKDYLAAKQDYLDWRKDFQMTQSDAQLELLNAQGKVHQEAIELHDSALANLEVTAPQNGILVYSKNWRGEKIRVGQSLWPGSKIASIPSLEALRANLYVLEAEAAGLEVGQQVNLILDAFPDRHIGGEVTSVANIAAPRTADSPVKYFEVAVKFSSQVVSDAACSPTRLL